MFPTFILLSFLSFIYIDVKLVVSFRFDAREQIPNNADNGMFGRYRAAQARYAPVGSYLSRREISYQTATRRINDQPTREDFNYRNLRRPIQLHPYYRKYKPRNQDNRLHDKMMMDNTVRSYDVRPVMQHPVVKEQPYPKDEYDKDSWFMRRRPPIVPTMGGPVSPQEMSIRRMEDRRVESIPKRQLYSQDRFERYPEDVNDLRRRTHFVPHRDQQELMQRHEEPSRVVLPRYPPYQRRDGEVAFRQTYERYVTPRTLYEYRTEFPSGQFFQSRGFDREYYRGMPRPWSLSVTMPAPYYVRRRDQFLDPRNPFIPITGAPDFGVPQKKFDYSLMGVYNVKETLGPFEKPRFIKPPKQYEVVTKMSIHRNFSVQEYKDLVDTFRPYIERTKTYFVRSTRRPDSEKSEVSEEIINATVVRTPENITYYEVPVPAVKIFWKEGEKITFSVSIPDNGIIAEYHFHGTMIKPTRFSLFVPGLWNKMVTEPHLGWFTYKSSNTPLEVGDTVYFWLMVVLTNGNRCIRDRLNFTIVYVNGTKYPYMFWNGTFGL